MFYQNIYATKHKEVDMTPPNSSDSSTDRPRTPMPDGSPTPSADT